jgi:VWFA-related protein
MSWEVKAMEEAMRKSQRRPMPDVDLHPRLCRRAILAVLLGALASAGVLAAQQPAKKDSAQDSSFVMRQTVRRVRVDVVVTDAQGHPVTGLQARDFHIAEDGNPQSIRQFEYHSDEKAEAALPKLPQLPPNTFMNLPAAPEHGPLMVVLYDTLNTQVCDQLFARAQMQQFLKENAGRRIAIFSLGDRLRLLQGFTSDPDLLASAAMRVGGVSLKGYRAELTGDPVSELASSGASTNGTNSPAGSAGGSGGRISDLDAASMRAAVVVENERLQEASQLLDDRVGTTLDALVQIGRFLTGFPGRKNLIWYSAAFPFAITPDPNRNINSFQSGSLVRDDSDRSYAERIKNATNALNSAEVAVYPVDARGLMNTGIACPPPPFRLRSAEFATMDTVGEQTGGRAFYNTNGLKEALETAGDEGGSYYSMVYAPTKSKFDGTVRSISVHLGSGHYHLAYRRRYIADDNTSIAPQKSAAGENAASPESIPHSADPLEDASQFGAPSSHQLVFVAHMDAIGAPAPATAEQMAGFVPYRERAAKVMHKKFVPQATPVSMQQYVIQYGVPVSQLDIPRSANGAYQSDLSMAALAFNEDGETLWGTKTELKDEIPVSKIGMIRKDGFQASQTLSVPVATAVIRLVIRDEHSGRIGSMEVRLPLPPDPQAEAARSSQ